MKKTTSPAKTLSLAILGASVLSSMPAELLTEDFEGYTADAALNTSGVWGLVTSSLPPTVRDETTSTVFGSPNQYGEFFDASTEFGIRVLSEQFTEASNAVTTFQFDFYEPTGGGDGGLTFGYSRDNELSSTKSRARVNLDDGTITGLTTTNSNTYSLDTVYTVYMILNDTTSPVAYDGGTLAASTADIWLQASGGSAYLAGSVGVVNSQASQYSVGFTTFSGTLQNVNIDNVSLFEGAAAVAEPSAGIKVTSITHNTGTDEVTIEWASRASRPAESARRPTCFDSSLFMAKRGRSNRAAGQRIRHLPCGRDQALLLGDRGIGHCLHQHCRKRPLPPSCAFSQSAFWQSASPERRK